MRDRLFISYSHDDQDWHEKLLVHLKPFERNNKLQVWSDKKIRAGERWRDEIEEALISTKVAVLLVSPNFLFSDFIVNHELPTLLEGAQKEGLRILWVAVSASAYEETEIKHYQAANNPEKPLDSLDPATLNQQLVKICQLITTAMTDSWEASDTSVSGSKEQADLRGSSRAAYLHYRQLPVARPGFRYLLDRWLPKLHMQLTTKIGVFDVPPEWSALNNYLSTFEAQIAKDIREKTDPYINPLAKDVPEDAQRLRGKRKGFLTPNQELIKEIAGLSRGGDSQDANISALSSKSKVVRNLVKRLMTADEPLILLGDPGMGKSLTLQRAAMLIAGQERKRIFPKVCLFLRLGGFHLSPGGMSSVWDYVRESTRQRSPGILPYLEDLAASGRLIIFFDGMDEMNRARYHEYTTALSVFAKSEDDRIKTLFSCRITDFSPAFEHYRLVLLPFTYDLVLRYLTEYNAGLRIKIGAESLTAKQLAKKLISTELPVQATNPFVLWLLCRYIQERESLPESRVDLLEHFNRSNYFRKMGPNGGEPAMNKAFQTWSRIAYEITDRNTGTEIELSDLESFLEPAELAAVQEGKQCGVLEEALDWDPPKIQFQHHRFQEYFTALYLFNNKEKLRGFSWLKKLDAPRWQETLFNLVIMEGGDHALVALTEAIKEGLEEFNQFEASEKTEDNSPAETSLADRVELASRILQQTHQQQTEPRSQLLAQTQRAAYTLSEKGNPITQVKMLLAGRIVPEINIWRVAREPLNSPVSWVSQQAHIVTSSTEKPSDESVLEEDNPSRTLRSDMLHSFASSNFLTRLNYYFNIAKALKQKRVWIALAIGLLLTLSQFVVSYGLIATAHRVSLPAFIMTEAWAVRSINRAIVALEKEATRKNDQSMLRTINDARQITEISHEQFGAITSEIEQTLRSKWFYRAGHLIILLAFIFSLRHAPGQQSLYIQAAGFLWLMLPLTLWPLWRGHLAYVLLVAFFVILALAVLSVTGRILVLLVQSIALVTFVASTSHRANQKIQLFALLRAVRQNREMTAWQKEINKLLVGAASVPVLLLAGAYLSGVDWDAVEQNVKNNEAIMFALKIGAIAVLCVGVLVCLAVAFFVISKVRRSAALIGFIDRAKESDPTAFFKIAKGADLWGMLQAAGCFVLIIAAIFSGPLLTWIASRIGPIDNYVNESLVILLSPSFFLNVALSIVIYAEVLGLFVSIAGGVMDQPRSLRTTLKMAGVWTVVCLAFAALVFMVWGVSLIDFTPLWSFLDRIFGLFPFLPSYVNRLFSVAVFVELAGLLATLVVWFRKKDVEWRERLTILKVSTVISLVVVSIALIMWGFASLISLLLLGVYSVVYSGKLAQIFVVIVLVAALGAFLVLLVTLIRDMMPYLEDLRRRPLLSSEEWRSQFEVLEPDRQARLIRRTTTRSLPDLRNDAAFLSLLRTIEKDIKKEPALSAYWAKRNDLEAIERQKRI